MNITSFRLLAVAALALAGQASAQSFNLDDGNQTAPYGIPGATYGAAAAQVGTWTSLGVVIGTTAPLVDITGATTAVTLTRSSGGAVNANVYLLTGDDALLMCDIVDPGATATYTFNNLQAGDYAVYTYAWAPDLNTARTNVIPGAGAVEGTQVVGGPFTGGPHVQGTTYALHHFNNVAANGSIAFTFTVNTTFGSINGFQLVRSGGGGTPSTPFCFGDGTGTACPCGNTGAVGNGCGSSVNAAGGNLAATGSASIAADTLSLNGSGMANSSALYFQGTAQAGAGSGVVFGDGLRCAGGTIIRLGTKTNVGGSSSYPSGSTPISVKGANSAGGLRTYQCWYRNAAAFCNPETFNLTNGVQLTWVP